MAKRKGKRKFASKAEERRAAAQHSMKGRDPSQVRGYSQMIRVSCEFAEHARNEADRLGLSVIEYTRIIALEGGYGK